MRVEQQLRPMMDDREPGAHANDDVAAAPASSPQRPFFPAPELIATALDAGKIGVWSWEIASNRLTWSSNLEDIHQRPPGSFDDTFSFFENDIHPGDHAGVV